MILILQGWLRSREWIAEVNDVLSLCYGSSLYNPNCVCNTTVLHPNGYSGINYNSVGCTSGSSWKANTNHSAGPAANSVPKTHSSQSPFSSADTTAFNLEIRKFLQESYQLPFYPSSEVVQLKRIVSEKEEFLSLCKLIWNTYNELKADASESNGAADNGSAPGSSNNSGSTAAVTSGSGRVIAPVLPPPSNEISNVTKAVSDWKPSDSKPIPIDEDLASLSVLSKHVNAFISDNTKIPLFLLNALLNYSNRIPHGLIHKQLYPLVEGVYNMAMELKSNISEFLETCTWLKLTKRKYNKPEHGGNDGKTLHERMESLYNIAICFPVVDIPRAGELKVSYFFVKLLTTI